MSTVGRRRGRRLPFGYFFFAPFLAGFFAAFFAVFFIAMNTPPPSHLVTVVMDIAEIV